MENAADLKHASVWDYLKSFVFDEKLDLFGHGRQDTIVEYIEIEETKYPKFINEFWTSRQRQANSLHEIAYRACFKPQLPRFFIALLTNQKDIVYDPFSGRGTTVLEAAILNRNIIANDINPLSKIMVLPRLFVPDLHQLEKRLNSIHLDDKKKADIDLSMFYHPKTESEIMSLKQYLKARAENGEEDEMDAWIRMVATNRLTGHSSGFFSVYTLPPNQAVSQESQKKINEKRRQKPEYRNVSEIILKKTKSLLKDVSPSLAEQLHEVGIKAIFLCEDARLTKQIQENSVQLTVTSPPFLDIVQYAEDNWLRCWFNSVDPDAIGEKITMSRRIEDWCAVMSRVFEELYRITKSGGYVAFEVGEVRSGTIKLDEHIVPLSLKAGFKCEGILINTQSFTKTSNIWGINNNTYGTNTNRIVLLKK